MQTLQPMSVLSRFWNGQLQSQNQYGVESTEAERPAADTKSAGHNHARERASNTPAPGDRNSVTADRTEVFATVAVSLAVVAVLFLGLSMILAALIAGTGVYIAHKARGMMKQLPQPRAGRRGWIALGVGYFVIFVAVWNWLPDSVTERPVVRAPQGAARVIQDGVATIEFTFVRPNKVEVSGGLYGEGVPSPEIRAYAEKVRETVYAIASEHSDARKIVVNIKGTFSAEEEEDQYGHSYSIPELTTYVGTITVEDVDEVRKFTKDRYVSGSQLEDILGHDDFASKLSLFLGNRPKAAAE